MSRASRTRDALDAGEAALLADFDSYLAGDTVTPSPAPAAGASSMRTSSARSAPLSPTAALSLLGEVFPHLPARTIRCALSDADGDTERAAAVLAAHDTDVVDTDALIAERLQRAELEAARSSNGDSSGSRRRTQRQNASSARSDSRTDPDVATTARGQYGPAILANPRRPDVSHVLTNRVRKDVLRSLRDVIVPSLHAHFGEISFSDYHMEEPGFSFSLENVVVSALSLTPESIMVGSVSGGFRVNVVNLFVELDIGRWQYLSRTLFGLKDAGSARVSINGLTSGAMLIPRAAPGESIAIDVGEVEVTIEGPCRLRTEGSNADWAYNAAAVIMKPLVVSYVKDAVCNVVESSLAAQLLGWTAWSPPRPDPEPQVALDIPVVDDISPECGTSNENPSSPDRSPKAGNTQPSNPS